MKYLEQLRNVHSYPPLHTDDRRLSHMIGVCVAACSESMRSSDAPHWQGRDGVGEPVTMPHTAEIMSLPTTVSPADSNHRDHQDGQDATRTPQEGRSQMPSRSSASLLHTDRKLLLTVEEAAQRLSLGRTLVYALVMRKQIASLTVGRARRIPVAALDEFVTRELAHTHEGGRTV